MIPADALLGHIGNLGKTGSGKTYTTKAEIVEPLLDAGRQVAIVDPTSAWWGLRLMPDGKKPSPYPIIILGGPHGDLALVASSGAACARLVTDQLASVVFDTGAMTVADRTRWFTDFAGELYRSVRQPLTVVIDEVHCFAPQARKLGPQQAMMLHAASELFSGGRSRGLRMIGLSQRPAKWHKDSLTSVDALMLHKLMAPQDRAAAKEWIDGQGDAEKSRHVLGSLASLKKGEYWFWFPDDDILERRQSPKIKTFDSSATPVHGAPRVDVQKIDLGQVKAALAEAAKEAEANDPKHLRARIEQLEDDLAAALAGGGESDPDANGTSAMQAEIDRLETALHDAQVGAACAQERRDELLVEMEAMEARCWKLIEQHSGDLRQLATWLSNVRGKPAPAAGTRPQPPSVGSEARRLAPADERHTVATRANVAKPAAKATTGQGGELSGPEQRVLGALAIAAALRLEVPTRTLVAASAGYSPTSSTFANILSSLRSKGMVEYPNGETLRFAPGGRAAAPKVTPLRSLAELHARVLEICAGPERRCLQPLLDHGTRPMAREKNAGLAGYSPTSSTYANVLSSLRSKGFVDYPSSDSVQATEALFPAGLK